MNKILIALLALLLLSLSLITAYSPSLHEIFMPAYHEIHKEMYKCSARESSEAAIYTFSVGKTSGFENGTVITVDIPIICFSEGMKNGSLVDRSSLRARGIPPCHFSDGVMITTCMSFGENLINESFLGAGGRISEGISNLFLRTPEGAEFSKINKSFSGWKGMCAHGVLLPADNKTWKLLLGNITVMRKTVRDGEFMIEEEYIMKSGQVIWSSSVRCWKVEEG